MKKGVIYSFAAYFLWGFIAIYFKSVQNVPAVQILAHRVVWSFIFLLIIVLLRREIGALFKSLTRRILLIYLVAGVLLSINWLTYVWAVNTGHVVEGSLGYFINPLVSVILGVVLLREKLRPLQWLPVGLAAGGVAYLTISLGEFPWISLVLALSFGLYGLMKKVAPLSSLHGLTLETALIFIPAFAFLLVADLNGAGSFARAGASTSLLLSMAGPITVIPLIFFAIGARLIPLTLLGFIQYISPTLQFLLGVFVYHESFTTQRLIGFSIIWVALIIYSVEEFLHHRRKNHSVTLQNQQINEGAAT